MTKYDATVAFLANMRQRSPSGKPLPIKNIKHQLHGFLRTYNIPFINILFKAANQPLTAQLINDKVFIIPLSKEHCFLCYTIEKPGN